MKEFFAEIPCIVGERLTIRRITKENAGGLARMCAEDEVYGYEPTFLFEKKYPDANVVIEKLYDECLEESLILGVFLGDEFCGLAEFYGLNNSIHKISVGYRFMKKFWGRGIASEALGMMLDHLDRNTDIEIVTASTLPENQASARVLRKNGFELVVRAKEDWGYDSPLDTDKWVR